MEIDKIYDLIIKAEKSSFDKIEIKTDDFTLRLERNCAGTATPKPAAACQETVIEIPVAAETLETPQKSNTAEVTGDDIVFAPISGVFYVAKEPGVRPFVEEGQKVSKSDPLCIIEAMKMMNEICAPKAGVIECVLAEDGQTIKANDALFRYAKAD